MYSRMQSPQSLATLAKYSLPNKVLCGALLPQNNNSSFIKDAAIFNVTIMDKDGKTPVAYGAITRYNTKQAYCILGEVAKEFKDNTIWIEAVETEEKLSKVFQITHSVPHSIDRKGLPSFQSVFGNHNGRPIHLHLVDALIEGSIGTFKMDIDKNITVDLIENGSDSDEYVVSQWRDISGFVVSDRFKYEQIVVRRSDLLSLKSEDVLISIEEISDENVATILDYDAELTAYDRSEYLTALIQTTGVFAHMAIKNGEVCGYSLALNDRILQCYADDESTTKQLLASMASKINHPEIYLFVRLEINETIDRLCQVATSRSRVNRLHTRSNIGCVKWSHVPCPNIGLHIF